MRAVVDVVGVRRRARHSRETSAIIEAVALARRALATRFDGEEPSNTRGDPGKVDGVVEHDEPTRSQPATDRPHRFVAHGRVEQSWPAPTRWTPPTWPRPIGARRADHRPASRAPRAAGCPSRTRQRRRVAWIRSPCRRSCPASPPYRHCATSRPRARGSRPRSRTFRRCSRARAARPTRRWLRPARRARPSCCRTSRPRGGRPLRRHRVGRAARYGERVAAVDDLEQRGLLAVQVLARAPRRRISVDAVRPSGARDRRRSAARSTCDLVRERSLGPDDQLIGADRDAWRPGRLPRSRTGWPG